MQGFGGQTAQETSDILTQVVQDVRTILGCDEASIILWDARLQHFEIGAATNAYSHSIAERVRTEGGATRWILDHQEPLIINDMDENPVQPNTITHISGITAFAGVPILYKGEVLGVLYALSTSGAVFDERQTIMLQSLANMTATAVYNARLAQRLQELNAFKDAMMGLAAHDLRNPLSRVVGYLNILLEDLAPLSEEHHSWVDQIFRALQQMEDLIDGILHYEQLSQEGERATFEVHDLNDLVASVAEQFGHDLAQKDQNLVLDLTETPMPLPMDVLLLGEALGNLVANAIKYSPPDTQITLSTHFEEGRYQVWVADEGPGIDPQYHEKIFQPFTRLPEAKAQRGSGLGLNLVKTIVEQHGGAIHVESQPGQGSTFIVSFPQHETG